MKRRATHLPPTHPVAPIYYGPGRFHTCPSIYCVAGLTLVGRRTERCTRCDGTGFIPCAPGCTDKHQYDDDLQPTDHGYNLFAGITATIALLTGVGVFVIAGLIAFHVGRLIAGAL